MNSQILGLRVASFVFGLVSLAQFARFLLRIDVSIGGYQIPHWPSLIAFIFSGALSGWLCKTARVQNK